MIYNGAKRIRGVLKESLLSLSGYVANKLLLYLSRRVKSIEKAARRFRLEGFFAALFPRVLTS